MADVMKFSIRDCMDFAAKKCGVAEWQAYQWSAADGGGHIIRGCVPSGVYQRGKNKGLPKFRPAIAGTERTVVVSDQELTQWAVDWESDTGNCFQCKGSGEEWCGWSKESGNRSRPCSRCGSTGKAP